MIRLLVKGSKDEACAAARQRKVELLEATERTPTETFCLAELSQARRIYDWFGDPGQAPFPPGTLLYFVDLSGRELSQALHDLEIGSQVALPEGSGVITAVHGAWADVQINGNGQVRRPLERLTPSRSA